MWTNIRRQADQPVVTMTGRIGQVCALFIIRVKTK